MKFYEKNGKNENGSALTNLKRIFVGVLMGIAVFLLLLLLFSLIMTISAVPDGFSSVFSFVALSLGAFASGFFALWKIGKSGLINGLICGGILAAIHLLLSLVFGDGGRLVFILISVIIELVLSTLGGIVSVNVKPD